jgi:hypothetical protein
LTLASVLGGWLQVPPHLTGQLGDGAWQNLAPQTPTYFYYEKDLATREKYKQK